MEQTIFEVGRHKGEWDFRISSLIGNYSREEMAEISRMIIVAIGTMEQMYRSEQERKHPAYQNINP